MNNFTMIQNEIFNYNISGQAFRLYCVLRSFCFGNKNTCYPSQKTLAEKLNKSIRTIQRNLKELVKVGLIKIKRRGSISNIYVLTQISQASCESKSTEGNNTITDTSCKNTEKNSISVPHNLDSLRKHKNSYKNTPYNYNKNNSFDRPHQRKYKLDKIEAILLGNSPVPDDISEFFG